MDIENSEKYKVLIKKIDKLYEKISFLCGLKVDKMVFHYFYLKNVKEIKSEANTLKKELIKSLFFAIITNCIFLIVTYNTNNDFSFSNDHHHTPSGNSGKYGIFGLLFELLLSPIFNLLFTVLDFIYPFIFPVIIYVIIDEFIEEYRSINLPLKKLLSDMKDFLQDDLDENKDYPDSIYDQKLKEICFKLPSIDEENAHLEKTPQIFPPLRIFGSNSNRMRIQKDHLCRCEELVFLTFYFFESEIHIHKTSIDVICNEIKINRLEWQYKDISTFNDMYPIFYFRNISGESIQINTEDTSYTKLHHTDHNFTIDNANHLSSLKKIILEKRNTKYI